MTQLTDINAAIVAINNLFKEIIKSDGAASKVVMDTQDRQILPTKGDFITGQETIRTFWQSVMEMGIKESRREKIKAESHEDKAIEVSKDEQSSTVTKRDFILTWD
jgi:ketosteroid isomerase-like protein